MAPDFFAILRPFGAVLSRALELAGEICRRAEKVPPLLLAFVPDVPTSGSPGNFRTGEEMHKAVLIFLTCLVATARESAPAPHVVPAKVGLVLIAATRQGFAL
ncbi:MAG: hypothetical protein ACXVIO_14425, partial [Candidatus Angelobacter sp.]